MIPFTLVTGASRGIGRAIALEAARQGHDLALVCLQDQGKLDEVVTAAKACGSRHVFSYLADVVDVNAVDELFAAAAKHRLLTGVVNSAGFVGDRLSLPELPVDVIQRVLDVNVRGTILCCRAAARQMSRASGGAGGAIVNLSSQSATFGGDRLAVYSASKAAINGFTVSLARELAPVGIRVNAVSPGPVLTEPVQALEDDKLLKIKASLPMGRFCEPEEVARTVLWLLSDVSSYVSGAIVPVHGAR